MKANNTIWDHYSTKEDYPELKQNMTADVAIIGGGITGISTGLLLAQLGMKVIVLESKKIGGVSSSSSTGNLYLTIDQTLSSLLSKYDINAVKEVANSRVEVLRKIRSWVNDFRMECDYKEVPFYLYSNDDDSLKNIDKEFQCGVKAGVPYLIADKKEIPFPHKKGIKLPLQNQINPKQYVQQLARAAKDNNCIIYEQSHVKTINREEDRFTLELDNGKIEAEYVVHATHTPKGIKMVQTVLGPYREYGIGCEFNRKNISEGIYWGYHEDGKKFSTRIYSKNGKEYLIVVGEPHRTGQAADNKQQILNLERFAKQHFDIKSVDFRWGGQHYRPADLLPYIGPVSKGSKEYIATGFSTDGLVYGTLSGMIISDLIRGHENKWYHFYSANRHHPLKSAPKFIEENVNVAKQYLNDYGDSAPDATQFRLEDVQAGEGRVVNLDGKKLAVYRNLENDLEIVSAVCTHMKCIVHWNNAEKSWDCPCHGSRFNTDGSVIEGPAYRSLEKAKKTEKTKS